MMDDRAELQTETTMDGQERITGHLRSQRAVTQDEMRQDGEHGFARGALDTPDGETTQADTGIVGVARQTPTRAAAGLVGELKAESEEKREHEFNKRFGGAQERKVGRLITEVDGDRAVVAYRFGGVFHVSSPGQMSLARMRQDEGKVLKEQTYSGRIETSPLNPGECEKFGEDFIRGPEMVFSEGATDSECLLVPAVSWTEEGDPVEGIGKEMPHADFLGVP